MNPPRGNQREKPSPEAEARQQPDEDGAARPNSAANPEPPTERLKPGELGSQGRQDAGKRAVIWWLVGALIVLLCWGLIYAVDVLLVVFSGLLFAILLSALAGFIQRRTKLGDGVSLTLAVLTTLALIGAFAWLLVPPIVEQVSQIPTSVEEIKGVLERYAAGRWLIRTAPELEAQGLGNLDLISRATGIVMGTVGAIGTGVLIFFLGIFFAADPKAYRGGLMRLAPLYSRNRVEETLKQVGCILQAWMVGQFYSMLIVGFLTWMGLAALGVKYALSLGVLAGTLNFIPNFGPILAGIPATLVGLINGPYTALGVVALFLVLQTLEGYLITPMIQRRMADVPPALLITSQLVFGVFLGGIGIALAAPLTMATLVIVRMAYVEDVLGDRQGNNSCAG